MNETEMEQLADRLAALPGVVAVTLGGSRAVGNARPDSDWDVGLYYRGTIDPADVEALGWPGRVTGPGGWGPVVNGGAWLTVDGANVDLCYRDLDEVLHWVEEAKAGRFRIERLSTHSVGIPTYVLVGELAVNRVLVGELPRPAFPDALTTSAPAVWRSFVGMTLYMASVHATRGDVTATVTLLGQAVLGEAHARLAASREWALNEKGIAERAGLAEAHPVLAAVGISPEDLEATVRRMSQVLAVAPAALRVEPGP
ncbi:MAG TPA: nucleotidyltransferase domain-containing protein [Acidimicrobiales bacterium]|nr:nucleotidyltransferase domain-containing protein [Acidimicrobiales bacterium]